MIQAVGTAKRYWMRLPNGDSMIGLVDDEMGLLVIWEYDGCWGHRWNIDHLGPGPRTGLLSGLAVLTPQQALDAATSPLAAPAQSLTSFILGASAEYLASKLVPSDKKYAIDDVATRKAYHQMAADNGLQDDEELREAIESADWDEVAACRVDGPLAGFIDDHGLVSDLLVHTDSRWMLTVRDMCIPALKAAIREAQG